MVLVFSLHLIGYCQTTKSIIETLQLISERLQQQQQRGFSQQYSVFNYGSEGLLSDQRAVDIETDGNQFRVNTLGYVYMGDSVDLYFVDHQTKSIFHAKNILNSRPAYTENALLNFPDSISDEICRATIDTTLIDQKKKLWVTLWLKKTILGVTSVHLRYNHSDNYIEYVEYRYEKNSNRALSKTIFNYQPPTYGETPFQENTLKSHILDSRNNLLPRWQSYHYIDYSDENLY